jgi:hypothetical protein
VFVPLKTVISYNKFEIPRFDACLEPVFCQGLNFKGDLLAGRFLTGF